MAGWIKIKRKLKIINKQINKIQCIVKNLQKKTVNLGKSGNKTKISSD